MMYAFLCTPCEEDSETSSTVKSHKSGKPCIVRKPKCGVATGNHAWCYRMGVTVKAKKIISSVLVIIKHGPKSQFRRRRALTSTKCSHYIMKLC